MTDRLLVVDQVAVEFAGLRALDSVSLTLRPGEILGLIGPNGSGKTTMVNAITGQVPLTSGSIRFGEVEIAGLAPPRIALLGIMRSFQIARLFDQLTVIENVETAALTHGASRRAARVEAETLLATFGLAARADDLAVSLTFGDRRRVEIARALIARPAFLLLDEPAAGMNEQESEALMTLLAGLPEERALGLLVIDHDMHLITGLCHRLQVIASGRTIAGGPVEAVIKDPKVIEAYLGTTGEAGHAPA